MSDTKELLAQLQKMSRFCDTASSLDEILDAVVRLVATMLRARRFMLVDRTAKPDSAHFEVIRSMTRNAIAPERLRHLVFDMGLSMLVTDVPHEAQCISGEERATRGHAIVWPLRVGDEIIALVCMSEPSGKESFDGDDLTLVEIARTFIGRSLQAIHLQNVLRSRFAQLALARHEGELRPSSLPLPNQMARILAKTFYSEMTRGGFGSSQIISVVSEIISQLSGSLKRKGARSRDSVQHKAALHSRQSLPSAVARQDMSAEIC